MQQGVTAIVPAREENDRLRRVLDVLTSYGGFHEIIVVTSGNDSAESVTRRYAQVRHVHQDALGKGQAMEAGVRSATTDIIFFCDADIYGLTPDTVDRIVRPIVAGQADMSVAVRGRGVAWLTGWLARLWPTGTLVAGERALRRHVWETMPEAYKRGFRAEHGLNLHVRRSGLRLQYHLCPEIQQVPKEEKYGWGRGLARRLVEAYDVVVVLLGG